MSEFFVSGFTLGIGGFSDVEGYANCKLAFIEIVSGQSLAPTEFAFNNGGVWTCKPGKGGHGNFGFLLDGARELQDATGNGFNFNQSGDVGFDRTDLPPYIT